MDKQKNKAIKILKKLSNLQWFKEFETDDQFWIELEDVKYVLSVRTDFTDLCQWVVIYGPCHSVFRFPFDDVKLYNPRRNEIELVSLEEIRNIINEIEKSFLIRSYVPKKIKNEQEIFDEFINE